VHPGAPNPRSTLRIGLAIPQGAELVHSLGDEPRRLRRRSLRSALRRARLKPVGDNLDGPSSAAVGGPPLAALEPSLDVDEASLAEVRGGEVSELTPEDHVVELGVLLPLVATRTVVTCLPEAVSRISGAATRRPMRVTWFTESPRNSRLGAEEVSVVMVLLLRISCTSCGVGRCHGEKRADRRAEHPRRTQD
jgi:hypothetical protein